MGRGYSMRDAGLWGERVAGVSQTALRTKPP